MQLTEDRINLKGNMAANAQSDLVRQRASGGTAVAGQGWKMDGVAGMLRD